MPWERGHVLATHPFANNDATPLLDVIERSMSNYKRSLVNFFATPYHA
jgi:hypothetical protein